MRDGKRSEREKQIAAAAYDVLTEKGYAGTSMLAIARRAKASNETLYNWYGDKRGLFKGLITQNSEEVRDLLEGAERDASTPLQTLEALGPVLLKLLLSDRAIALNRAAAADATGVLGQSLSDAGRATVLPLIGRLLLTARDRGDIDFEALEDPLEVYIGLLVGDLQIRRVIGALSEPSEADIASRAAKATARFLLLFPTKDRGAATPDKPKPCGSDRPCPDPA